STRRSSARPSAVASGRTSTITAPASSPAASTPCVRANAYGIAGAGASVAMATLLRRLGRIERRQRRRVGPHREGRWRRRRSGSGSAGLARHPAFGRQRWRQRIVPERARARVHALLLALKVAVALRRELAPVVA